MQWYFLSDTQQQVPVQEEHLAGLVQTGVVRPNTMIWREGMAEWISCSEAKPELFAQRQVVPVVGAAATARQTAALHSPASSRSSAGASAMQIGDGQIVREAALTFASASVWMKLVGVLFLIGGVVCILSALFIMVTGVSVPGMLIPAAIISLVSAVVGAVAMWMGILLFQSATKAQEAAASGQKHALLSALNQNAKFFRIWGITAALAFAVYGLIFALAFTGVMGGALFHQLGQTGMSEVREDSAPESMDEEDINSEVEIEEVEEPGMDNAGEEN